MAQAVARNPNWSEEETTLALDLYMRHRPTLLDDTHPDVIELSETLRLLAEARGVTGTASFRNPNGVAMKLGNLSSHDPEAPEGRKGLRQGAQGMEALVWEIFGDDVVGLAQEAARIRATIGVEPRRAGPSPTQRIFVTGMWGFNPDKEGYVGFTNKNTRDRYIAQSQPGDLMLIVGQQGPNSQKVDVGRALGVVELDPIPIHETARMAPETYARKVELFGEESWQFGMPIKRAWKLESNIKAQHIAPTTCAARNARVIGANFKELTDAEVGNVLGARMRAVPVYGAEEWNEGLPDLATPEVGRDAFARGPAPSFGTWEINRQEGPSYLYVMVLEGCVDALFPTERPATNRRLVIKVGRSTSVERRQTELNWGFPPGADVRWVVRHSKLHTSETAAHAAESDFLDYLRKRDMRIGGEFAIIPERELDHLIAMFVDRKAGVVIA